MAGNAACQHTAADRPFESRLCQLSRQLRGVFFPGFFGPRRRTITPDGGEPELTRAVWMRLRWWWARGSHAEALENGLLFNKR